MGDKVSILDGSTFLVCRPNGDIDAAPDEAEGLFYKDMRHLSVWRLRLNGQPLQPLSTDTVEYYFAQHFCMPPLGVKEKDSTLSVIRRRYIGDGFVEDLTLLNHAQQAQEIELRLEVDADFADLFEVKDALRKKGALHRHVQNGQLVLGYQRDRFERQTRLASTVPVSYMDSSGVTFRLRLEPKARWNTRINVQTVTDTVVHPPKFSTAAGKELRTGLRTWLQHAPRLDCHIEMVRLYMRSLTDVAALRFHPDELSRHSLPAAGLPWFMAMFGRDSLITSYQLLPFAPELAATTLRALAETQGKQVMRDTEEEPGRILHELRHGELAFFHERPQSPYYGASDTTPLFLVLLDEYERWSGDTELVRALEPNARAAVEWMDHFGDRDGDGYIEYERKTDLGLENQCWKDSWNSILFRDGTLAPTPRATCELQGYAYDARLRCARLARAFWNDPGWADKLEAQARQLRQRFQKDFWMPDRQCFALALDGRKRQVDSLTSNLGHLLWSGIVDEDKAQALRDHLMSPALFSGWGIRSMAQTEGGYSPIGYHIGTVWPHDCSLIAAGLARYGYRADAAVILAGIIEASIMFRYRLPEVFAGYDRARTRFPVEYATACSPQAWAAGAPMLAIRTLLGLEPKGEQLIHDEHPVLPPWFGFLSLEGIPGRWGRATVSVTGDKSQMLDTRQIYEHILSNRSVMGDEELAA